MPTDPTFISPGERRDSSIPEATNRSRPFDEDQELQDMIDVLNQLAHLQHKAGPVTHALKTSHTLLDAITWHIYMRLGVIQSHADAFARKIEYPKSTSEIAHLPQRTELGQLFDMMAELTSRPWWSRYRVLGAQHGHRRSTVITCTPVTSCVYAGSQLNIGEEYSRCILSSQLHGSETPYVYLIGGDLQYVEALSTVRFHAHYMLQFAAQLRWDPSPTFVEMGYSSLSHRATQNACCEVVDGELAIKMVIRQSIQQLFGEYQVRFSSVDTTLLVTIRRVRKGDWKRLTDKLYKLDRRILPEYISLASLYLMGSLSSTEQP